MIKWIVHGMHCKHGFDVVLQSTDRQQQGYVDCLGLSLDAILGRSCSKGSIQSCLQFVQMNTSYQLVISEVK